MLLGGREVDDGCAAGWERVVVNCLAAGRERLGGRGLCCWAGERWMTVALLEGGRTARRDAGWEGAGLLGGRVVADCWAGERWTPRWERAVLLGRREVEDLSTGVVALSWYTSLQ